MIVDCMRHMYKCVVCCLQKEEAMETDSQDSVEKKEEKENEDEKSEVRIIQC